MFDPKEAEGTKRRHQVDTVVEGMYVPSASPLDRISGVLMRVHGAVASIDLQRTWKWDYQSSATLFGPSNYAAIHLCYSWGIHITSVTDAEAVAMSRYLVRTDGLFLGSSSACNLVACVKLAKKMGWKDGETIVTILCDSGNRHYSKVCSTEVLRALLIK